MQGTYVTLRLMTMTMISGWLQNPCPYVTAFLVEKQAEEELLDRLVEGVTQTGERVVVILALALY